MLLGTGVREGRIIPGKAYNRVFTVFTATLDFIMLVNQSKQVYLLLVRDELVFMVSSANASQRKMN